MFPRPLQPKLLGLCALWLWNPRPLHCWNLTSLPLTSGSLIPLQPLPLSFPASRKQPRRTSQGGLWTLGNGILWPLGGSYRLGLLGRGEVWLWCCAEEVPPTFLMSWAYVFPSFRVLEKSSFSASHCWVQRSSDSPPGGSHQHMEFWLFGEHDCFIKFSRIQFYILSISTQCP